MNFLQWWLSPKFPDVHFNNVISYKPQGMYPQIRNWYRTWIVHPIKRRVSKYYVFILQKFFGLNVIGITGSAGKTTTKEMLASILSLNGETVYSFANIDPIYNIPTTILRCKTSTKYLILEMGVEYKNEMDFYLWLAKPNLGIITNIYPTHTLNFKNEEGVLKEKSKLLKGLDYKSYAFLNLENVFLKKLKHKGKAKTIWYGNESEIYDEKTYYDKFLKTNFVLNIRNKKRRISLPLLGKQFVKDSLAAAAAADALGIDIGKIKQGLESFKRQDHRMNIKKLKFSSTLIDDTYNNNPEAAKEAILLLKEISQNKYSILIFGDMLELGDREIEYHKKIGQFIKDIKFDYVLGVGPNSKYISKNNVPTWSDGVGIIKKQIRPNAVIMAKGSRSINLDKLVAALDYEE